MGWNKHKKHRSSKLLNLKSYTYIYLDKKKTLDLKAYLCDKFNNMMFKSFII